mmetsp:Transcript_12851/g.36537  ORF Transcript_12851/g.36537 Transcript_12851/m.36537 type:complete len:91 (-) Transcript_12851:655-927(-)
MAKQAARLPPEQTTAQRTRPPQPTSVQSIAAAVRVTKEAAKSTKISGGAPPVTSLARLSVDWGLAVSETDRPQVLSTSNAEVPTAAQQLK